MTTTTLIGIYFIIFCVILLGGSAMTRKWASDSDDYILAGRQISMLVNVFGVCAIGFAGTTITLGPSYAITYGLKGFLAYTLSYPLIGLGLYGVLFGRYIRRCGANTLSEWLEMRFSPSVRLVITCASVFGLIGIMTNNVISMAGNLSAYTGWNQMVTLALCFLIILFFAFMSGMWAITLTDFLQMTLGFIAAPLLFLLMVQHFGGLSFISENWPGPLGWTGGGISGAQLSTFGMTYPSVILFCVPVLVWGNNYYWLRVASCRTEKVGRWSYIIGALILVFIINFPTALTGPFAAASDPEAFLSGSVASTAAYGYVIRNFAPAVSAFLMMAVVAASISTATTAHIGATSTAVRDIYQRKFHPNATPKELLKPTKIIMILVAFATWALAFFPGGPVYLFPFATSWLGPGLALLVLGVFWRRMTKEGALWGVISGLVFLSVFNILKMTGIFNLDQYFYIGTAGLLLTFLVCIVVSLCTKPDYYGEAGWVLDPAARKDAKVELQPMDIQILDLINSRFEMMSEIIDYLGKDGADCAEAIARLDQGGYIGRRALSGSNFFQFYITEKGKAMLPERTEEQKAMEADGFRKGWLEILKNVELSPSDLTKFAVANDISSMEMSSAVAIFDRLGYIKQKGAWRRELVLTENGKAMLQKYGMTA